MEFPAFAMSTNDMHHLELQYKHRNAVANQGIDMTSALSSLSARVERRKCTNLLHPR